MGRVGKKTFGILHGEGGRRSQKMLFSRGWVKKFCLTIHWLIWTIITLGFTAPLWFEQDIYRKKVLLLTAWVQSPWNFRSDLWHAFSHVVISYDILIDIRKTCRLLHGCPGTPTWPPVYCIRHISMAAVKSQGNTLSSIFCFLFTFSLAVH